ncbi:MAG: proline--tRNA ligase [Planctomycetota bacterium]
MPTRWSQTLIPTARQAPADAVVPSHQLLLRAGYIHPLAAGVYDYLPLGKRSLEKAIAIVRRHMDPISAEVFLPSLQPIDLWERTVRRAAYGDNLFVVTDRHGRESALGPTHEEVVTHLVGNFIKSYRDLPKSLYQIQTKFRDEFRPRFGLLRTREFQMKDAYSFHLPGPDDNPAGDHDDPGSLSCVYEQYRAAYQAIFADCGVPAMQVEAEAGPIGGDASHEFMCPTPTGEDTILVSDKGNYAANVEKCATGEREVGPAFDNSAETPTPIAELEKVHTPDIKSIDDLTAFWKKSQGSKLKPQNTLKTLVFGTHSIDTVAAAKAWRKVMETGPNYPLEKGIPHSVSHGHILMCVVRGDHEVNESKLLKFAQQEIDPTITVVYPQEPGTVDFMGMPIGFLGPQTFVENKWPGHLIVDQDATANQFWITGANETDHHSKGFDWNRDVLSRYQRAKAIEQSTPKQVHLGDIRNAVAGDPSPLNDGGVLEERKGIELGHIFKLGDKYTRALSVTVAGEDNQPVHPLMGCYGIGVNRILAAAIERDGGHDESGIVWPVALAPYHVVITPIKYAGEVKDTVDRLASELESRTLGKAADGVRGPAATGGGFVEVLIDDRDERPGPKFKDADLIGIPVRVTVGDKGLGADQPFVEIKARDGSNGDKGEQVPVDQAIDRVVNLLGKLA